MESVGGEDGLREREKKKEKRRGMRNGCVFERGEKLKELFTFVVNCTSMDDPMK